MRKILIDPEIVQLFLDVAETGNFSKVAERTGKSQPYISRALGSLEAEWGGRLFRRTGRGVELTDFGEAVVPQVKTWLADTQSLVENFKTYAGNPNGEVSIGSLPSTSSPMMSALFVRIRERFPGIRLRFREGYHRQIQSWLENGQVDIGIALSYESEGRKDEIPLIEFPTYLCGAAGDELTSRATVALKSMIGLPFILPTNPGMLTKHLNSISPGFIQQISPVLEVNSLSMQRDIVAAGSGYAILSYGAVADDIRAGRLQASLIVSPGITQYLSIGISRHGPITKVTREVIQQLRELVAEMVPQAKAPKR
jgi:DNA-binding transcriptional LysR family regulator